MSDEMGASADADRATAVEPVPVSSLRDGIPSAVPTLAERNEGYIPPHFDMAGGKLGETPILWKFRMAYKWSDDVDHEDPDWDQCCTCWVFAVSEGEARRIVWDKFKYSGAVMPEAIASCHPERFENQRDVELREYWSAQGIEAGTGETREAGLDAKHESPVAEGHASNPSPNPSPDNPIPEGRVK